MERLIYKSTAAPSVGTREVFDIVETSTERNPPRQITGFLLHDDDRFFQLIEGPAVDIANLLDELRADSRHREIAILQRVETTERLFTDWGMKRLISFTGEPAMSEIKRTVDGKDGAETIVQLVSEFLNISVA